MTIVDANGIQIRFSLEGRGPETVVLINGIGDDLHAWEYQMRPLLDSGFQVLRFDNRGVGASSDPPGPYSSELMADDLKALIDNLGIGPYHLVGVSMGGTIAQAFALRHPHNVRSLVLANTFASPGLYTRRIFSSWGEIASNAGMPVLMRQVAPWIFSRGFFEREPEKLANFIADMETTKQGAAAFVAQLGALVDHDTSGRLREIVQPALVLAASEDILIPSAQSRGLFSGLPHAEWTSIPGGHGAMWETADEFNAALIGFLNSNARGELHPDR
jgi:3-oxoadipate enol-lactonase